MKQQTEGSGKKVRFKEINRIMAYAAALMLTGVPAVVCESVLDDLYCSVRKSIDRIKA